MEASARSVVSASAVWRGEPYPLGATWDEGGVNFALLYRKTGTLAAPILLHASVDLAIIAMLFQAMAGTA